MPKTKAQKQQTVTELTDKLKSARTVVFTDYRGMTMTHLSTLRGQLRDQSGEFAVTKNTLLALAAKDAGLELPDTDVNQGPTATLFAYDDEITPIKTLVKALKDAQMGKIKGGFLGDRFLDAYAVNKLATLPSKDELRAKTVGVLVAPLQGMVGVLNANLRNLVYTLDQIRIKKS